MPFITIRRRGFPEAVRMMAMVQPGKQMTRLVRDVTSRLGVFVASITAVDTGAMRDSWTWTTVERLGQVYISLSAYNPRTRKPVIEYAQYPDDRYGIVDTALDYGGRIMFEALGGITWEPR